MILLERREVLRKISDYASNPPLWSNPRRSQGTQGRRRSFERAYGVRPKLQGNDTRVTWVLTGGVRSKGL